MHFIYQRNWLLIKILWICYLFVMITNYLYDPSLVWPPFGLIICGLVTIAMKLVKHDVIMMYVTLTSIFLYFFVLNTLHPELVNYLFLLFGVILSSLYQKYEAVVYSGVIAAGLLFYFFHIQYEQMLENVAQADSLFFLLFSILLVLFFLYHVKFTKQLWKQAQANEQMVKQQLHSTELNLDSFINHTHDAVLMFYEDGTIINSNPAFTKLYGWEKDEVVSKNIEHFAEGVALMVSKQESRMEMTHHNKEGETIFVDISLSSIEGKQENHPIILALILDLTDKKKAEEHLRESEKLTTAGRLAAGIAHELRNPLSVVEGFLQIATEENQAFSKHRELMLTELRRMNLMTTEFLVLAKPKDIEMGPVHLGKLFKEVLSLYKRPLAEQGIELVLNLDDDIPYSFGDETQIKQFFINVIRNGAEAMEGNPFADRGTITVAFEYSKEDIKVIIRDEGVGFPPYIIKKLGQPFVTTKENGTGLGLMIMKKIIDTHKGKLTVYNHPEKGAVVQATFPVIKSRDQVKKAEKCLSR
ncbi:ATP-binding protein [Halalkalibacter wakoensis]|nr:ATP-binding protein [Halalkalibacter wakoensis]